MEDEIDERIIQDDLTLETSHPDIDSALELHVGGDDFSYKTRTVDGTTEHLVMRLRKGHWKVHHRIDDDEVKTLDSEEMATFLIHKVKMSRAIRRRFIAIIILFLVVAIPVVAYSVLVLGIRITDDFEIFLITGGVLVLLLPIICIMMSSAQRSVDDGVYAIRPNLIEVFEKTMDLIEEPYPKKPLEQRIQRLQGSFRTSNE